MNSPLIDTVHSLLYPTEQLTIKPLGARIPINYHIIPENIRLMILQYVSRNKEILFDKNLKNHLFETIWGSSCAEEKMLIYKHFNTMELHGRYIMLTHDVDSLSAIDNIFKIAEIEESYGFHSSWNFIAFRYKWDEKIIGKLKDKGNEIGLHGFYHDNKLHLRSEVEINKMFDKIADKIKRYEIKGGRIPSWFVDRRLLKIFSRYFTYDTTMTDEAIYRNFIPAGCGCVRPYKIDNIVEIPTNINFGKTYTYKRFDINAVEHWTEKAAYISIKKGLTVCMTHPNKCHLYGPKRLEEYESFLRILHDNTYKSLLPSEVVEMVNKSKTFKVAVDIRN